MIKKWSSFSALLSVDCNLCFLCLPHRQMFFSLDTVLCEMLNVTSDHSCCCIKNHVYNNFNLCCFVSSIIELKKSYKFFCTNPSKVKFEFLRNSSTIFRSSYPRCFIQEAIFKIFLIFTGKQLRCCLFQACNFIKKRFQHRCFHVRFTKKNASEFSKSVF